MRAKIAREYRIGRLHHRHDVRERFFRCGEL
jgi:hypothetical protein